MRDFPTAKTARDTASGSDTDACPLSESHPECTPEPGAVPLPETDLNPLDIPTPEMVDAFTPEMVAAAIADPESHWAQAVRNFGHADVPPSRAPELAMYLLGHDEESLARIARVFPVEVFTIMAEAAHQRGLSAEDRAGLVGVVPGLWPAFFSAVEKHGFAEMAAASDFATIH